MKSWKTTLSGIGIIITTITQPRFWERPDSIAALFGAIGLILARDDGN